MTIPASSKPSSKKIERPANGVLAAWLVGSLMLITTDDGPPASVTSGAGSNRHCVPVGKPAEQDNVTVPVKKELDGFWATINWYAPPVCPACKL